jgi:hypothetical protein
MAVPSGRATRGRGERAIIAVAELVELGGRGGELRPDGRGLVVHGGLEDLDGVDRVHRLIAGEVHQAGIEHLDQIPGVDVGLHGERETKTPLAA